MGTLSRPTFGLYSNEIAKGQVCFFHTAPNAFISPNVNEITHVSLALISQQSKSTLNHHESSLSTHLLRNTFIQ